MLTYICFDWLSEKSADLRVCVNWLALSLSTCYCPFIISLRTYLDVTTKEYAQFTTTPKLRLNQIILILVRTQLIHTVGITQADFTEDQQQHKTIFSAAKKM